MAVLVDSGLFSSLLENTLKEQLANWGRLEESVLTGRGIFKFIRKSQKPGIKAFTGTIRATVAIELHVEDFRNMTLSQCKHTTGTAG